MPVSGVEPQRSSLRVRRKQLPATIYNNNYSTLTHPLTCCLWSFLAMICQQAHDDSSFLKGKSRPRVKGWSPLPETASKCQSGHCDIPPTRRSGVSPGAAISGCCSVQDGLLQEQQVGNTDLAVVADVGQNRFQYRGRDHTGHQP